MAAESKCILSFTVQFTLHFSIVIYSHKFSEMAIYELTDFANIEFIELCIFNRKAKAQ